MKYALLLASTVILIALLMNLRQRYGSYVSPAGAMVAVWLLCLSAQLIPIIEYTEITPVYWALYLLSVVAFFFGASLGNIFVPAQGILGTTCRLDLVHDQKVLMRSSLILFALAIVGAAAYYRTFDKVIGIDALWTDSNEVRHAESLGWLRESGGSGLEIFYTCLVPAGVLMALSVPLARGVTRVLRVIAFIMIVFILWLNSGRTALASLAVTTAAAIFLFRNLGRVNWAFKLRSKLVLFAVGALLIVNFQISSVSLKKAITAQDDQSILNLPEYLSWMVGIYHYGAAPLAAFPQLVENRASFPENGNLTFGVVSRILHQIWPSEFLYPTYVQPFSFIPVPTNVYTYLDAFFLDYGWLGIAAMPLFWGFVTTVIYAWMIRVKTAQATAVNSIIIYCCVSSVGVNRFGTLETWLWLFFICLITSGVSVLAPKNARTSERR
jgi:oligosaccharide repeat unit polymerase